MFSRTEMWRCFGLIRVIAGVVLFWAWLWAGCLGFAQENCAVVGGAYSGAHSWGYVSVDGGKLFFQRFGCGDPIIVLHGGPGLDQAYLQPQLLELAKDYELIFYDQRGSGKSLEVKVDADYLSMEQLSKDLDDLRKALGLKRFILLGHSWGSLLAMDYAIRRYADGVVSHLILLNPVSANYQGYLLFRQEWMRKAHPVENGLKALLCYEDFEKLNDLEIEQLYRTLFSLYFYDVKNLGCLNLKTNRASALSGFQVREIIEVLVRPHVDLFAGLRALKVPTLIIHGNQDIVPLSTVIEIKEAIPNAWLVCLDQCGHFPYIEKPDVMFASIRGFLGRVD